MDVVYDLRSLGSQMLTRLAPLRDWKSFTRYHFSTVRAAGERKESARGSIADFEQVHFVMIASEHVSKALCFPQIHFRLS